MANDPLMTTKRFKVVRRLAAGGMGEVLLADFKGDRKLQVSGGFVVVKRNLQNHPNMASQNAMLREEGRLGLRLLHENLVQTFSLEDLSAEDPILIMEFMAGKSMAQVLGAAKRSRTPLPVDVALKILRLSACGLHFAHALSDDHGNGLGLVHRDVSPANIFVTFDGKVKVIDFGVAKAKDSEIKTSQGILKGKIGYMSPEHATGDKLDPRADLWSLGVVLWEMLVADRLFAGQNPAATLFQIANRDIDPPSTRRPDIPPAVDQLCVRLLTRDRNLRTFTGAQLVAEIDAMGYNLDAVDLGRFLSQRFPEDAETGVADARRAARYMGKEPVPSGIVRSGVNEDATLVGDGAFLMEQARNIAASASASAPPASTPPQPATPGHGRTSTSGAQAIDLGAIPAAAADDDLATVQMDADFIKEATSELLKDLDDGPAPQAPSRSSSSQLPQRPPHAPVGPQGPVGPGLGHLDDENMATIAMGQPDLPTELVAQPAFASQGASPQAPSYEAPSQPSGQFTPPSGQFTPPSGQFTPPSGQFTPPSGQFTPPSGAAPHPGHPQVSAAAQAEVAAGIAPPMSAQPAGALPQSPTTQRTPTGTHHPQRTPTGTHHPQRTPTGTHHPQRTPTGTHYPQQTGNRTNPNAPLVIPAMGPSVFTIAATSFGVLALILGVVVGLVLQSRAEDRVPQLVRYVDQDGGDVVVARLSDVPATATQRYSVDFANPKLRAADGRRVDVDLATWMSAIEGNGLVERAQKPGTVKKKIVSGIPAFLVALALLGLFMGPPGFLKNEKARLPLRAVGGMVAFSGSAALFVFGFSTWDGLDTFDEPPQPPRLKVTHDLAGDDGKKPAPPSDGKADKAAPGKSGKGSK